MEANHVLSGSHFCCNRRDALMQAVILAGGKGKRLRPVTDQPKPLVKIGEQVLLDHIIHHAVKHGVSSIIVAAGYKADLIEKHVASATYPVPVEVVRENTALGTAGALLNCSSLLEDTFFVLYGDIYSTINLSRMHSFHRNVNADVTVSVHRSDHPQDSTVVSIDSDHRITQSVEKPGDSWRTYGSLTVSPTYILSKNVLKLIPAAPCDIAKDLLPRLIQKTRVYGYETDEFTKDIGTPDRLENVRAGRPERTAAFLDRDGTIIREVNLLSDSKDMELLEGAAEGIKALNENNILVIVVTNQPVVARGIITEEQLQKIHEELSTQLKHQGARLDAIYYCPHHPETHHPEANDPKYRRECSCRKPATGMIDEATKTFKINLDRSFVVGDQSRDIQLGKNAGCTTILLDEGYRGQDNKYKAKPDYRCKSLKEASDIIISKTNELQP